MSPCSIKLQGCGALLRGSCSSHRFATQTPGCGRGRPCCESFPSPAGCAGRRGARCLRSPRLPAAPHPHAVTPGSRAQHAAAATLQGLAPLPGASPEPWLRGSRGRSQGGPRALVKAPREHSLATWTGPYVTRLAQQLPSLLRAGAVTSRNQRWEHSVAWTPSRGHLTTSRRGERAGAAPEQSRDTGCGLAASLQVSGSS